VFGVGSRTALPGEIRRHHALRDQNTTTDLAAISQSPRFIILVFL